MTDDDLFIQIGLYESGDMDGDLEAQAQLFGRLVSSGLAWQLQGHYGRMAQRLIDAGVITDTGEVC